MVRDQRGEPAGPLAAEVARADMQGAAAWTLIARVAPGGPRGLADLPDEPADEVRIGELEDDAIRHPAGHGQGHRAVAGDPDRQLPRAGPGQLSSVPS